jgi:NADH-quinone oxidoreductase subunit L
MITRMHFLFELTPTTNLVIAAIGGATSLMAAFIATSQNDIKKVLAYSTVSQLGYMFIGVGVGAYASGVFHLMTHAFFKALLFLAAGLAIHAVAGEQDIRRLKGIGKLMPQTRLVFLIGSLALVGIPPFAGFFSKDSILAAALDRGWYGGVIFAAGEVGALLTGVYAFRLFFVVFTGEPDAYAREHFHAHHGQEGPLSMRWTVGVLGLLALVGGWIQFAPLWTPFTTWLDPIAAPLAEATNGQEAFASALAVGLGLAGIAIAWLVYGAGRVSVPRPVRLFEQKFYWDELYDLLWYRSSDLVSRALGTLVETPLIGGSIVGVVRGFGLGATGLGRAQNGLVRSYALAIAGGVAVLAVVFLSVR